MTHVAPKPPRWYFRPRLLAAVLCSLFGHVWAHEWSVKALSWTTCDPIWGNCFWECRRCSQRVGW